MKIRTRITPDGIIQERIFSTPTEPGPPASVSIEIPGYTQAGDEIGTGGIDVSGNSVSEEDVALLEAYAGADTLAGTVGKVTVTLFLPAMDILDYVGSYITIHDIGNGNSLKTIEFVESPGDLATIPGAYALDVSGKSLEDIRDDLITIINTGDAIFAPKAWSLAASIPSPEIPGATQLIISYTGEGGASGGAHAVDDSMDVLFEDTFTFPANLVSFSKYSMQDTTLDGRLSRVDPGDGCIIAPLTTTPSATWSARYPIHPNGITITGISLYSPSEWNAAQNVILNVRKTNASGESVINDVAGLLRELGAPGLSGVEGIPLWTSSVLGALVTPNRSINIGLNSSSEKLVLDENPKPSIYITVSAAGAVTSAPAAGAAKLFIHYRVNA